LPFTRSGESALGVPQGIVTRSLQPGTLGARDSGARGGNYRQPETLMKSDFHSPSE